MLYGGSMESLAEEFGFPKSNIGEALGWLKYKTEGFHIPYLTSFSLEKRFGNFKIFKINAK